MGYHGGTAAHVRGPAYHQTRVQGYPAEQEDHSRRPGPHGYPGSTYLQGTQTTLA